MLKRRKGVTPGQRHRVRMKVDTEGLKQRKERRWYEKHRKKRGKWRKKGKRPGRRRRKEKKRK